MIRKPELIVERESPSGIWKAKYGRRSVTWQCWTGNPFEALAALKAQSQWPLAGAPGADRAKSFLEELER